MLQLHSLLADVAQMTVKATLKTAILAETAHVLMQDHAEIATMIEQFLDRTRGAGEESEIEIAPESQLVERTIDALTKMASAAIGFSGAEGSTAGKLQTLAAAWRQVLEDNTA